MSDFNAEPEVVSENSIDNTNRLQYIIIPPWVYSAVKQNNISNEAFVNVDMLINILSKADVENYYLLNCFSNKFIDTVFPGIPGLQYELLNPYNHMALTGNNGVFSAKEFIAHYFGNSDYIAETLESFYYTITPLYDNVMGIRFEKVDASENVVEKQTQALKDFITIARKYCSWESLARHQWISQYLKSFGKLLSVK